MPKNQAPNTPLDQDQLHSSEYLEINGKRVEIHYVPKEQLAPLF